jgi:hypothetical protein
MHLNLPNATVARHAFPAPPKRTFVLIFLVVVVNLVIFATIVLLILVVEHDRNSDFLIQTTAASSFNAVALHREISDSLADLQ